MNCVKRAAALLLSVLLGANLLLVSASADTPFIDNARWHEVSAQTVTQRYNEKGSFVVMFFRQSCFNSNLRKTMLDDWMTRYDLDVYGVDVDSDNIPSWVTSSLGTSSVTLPVICIVENGAADCFTAKDSMRSIQKRLQEYLGIYDETEIDFSTLNTETYTAYSTHASTAEARYCMSRSDIPAAIRSEAETATSGAVTQREKVKAIYDWVTTNIYYNYGMLDGTVARETSALETYTNKNSVCLGYANLTAAMCNAVGIPCRVVTGFAAGVGTENSTSEVWERYKAYLTDRDLDAFARSMASDENHAWNEAYVDGAWIILDTTWGSNNDYYPDSQGLITGTPTDAYFDPDLAWFSESHLFWTDYSADLTVTVQNGAVTVTGTLDPEAVASAEHCLVAAYDANGKMLACAAPSLSGTSFSQVLNNAGRAERVKVFLLGERYAPAAAPYFGKVE